MSYTEVSNFGAQKTIDVAHHEIHAGDAYSAYITTNNFDKSTELGLIFTTPNSTAYMNMIYAVYCGTDAKFNVLEAPTIDTGNYPTSFATPRNRNRNSSNTSAVLSVEATPAANKMSSIPPSGTTPITASGTALVKTYFGGNKNLVGAVSRELGELILKADTTYYLRLLGEGTGTDNEIGEIHVLWYEHTDKTDQELLDNSYDGQVITRAMRFKSY